MSTMVLFRPVKINVCKQTLNSITIHQRKQVKHEILSAKKLCIRYLISGHQVLWKLSLTITAGDNITTSAIATQTTLFTTKAK